MKDHKYLKRLRRNRNITGMMALLGVIILAAAVLFFSGATAAIVALVGTSLSVVAGNCTAWFQLGIEAQKVRMETEHEGS